MLFLFKKIESKLLSFQGENVHWKTNSRNTRQTSSPRVTVFQGLHRPHTASAPSSLSLFRNSELAFLHLFACLSKFCAFKSESRESPKLTRKNHPWLCPAAPPVFLAQHSPGWDGKGDGLLTFSCPTWHLAPNHSTRGNRRWMSLQKWWKRRD